MVRILAFSDLHRDLAAARAIVAESASADVVVGAGDFATHGKGLADTLDILDAIEAPLVVVAGNHDDLDQLRGALAHRKHAHVLHGSAISLSGIEFYGLGFEIGTTPGALPQSILSETQAAKHLKDCPRRSVLVTHAPPHGVADIQRDGSHQGSTSIRACIETASPVLNLCGHIHNAWGATGTIGDCRIVNLGPRVHWFDV
jgi:uncharacterized protein